MKITIDSTRLAPGAYMPPAIGNGELSLLIDMEGGQSQREYHGMTPGIRRAGFRYDTRWGELVPFGHFTQSLTGLGEPVSFRQSLDSADGTVECDCRYSDGTRIQSTVFCHLEHNIVAVRKRIDTRLTAPFEFRYSFAPRRTVINARDGYIGYSIDGLRRDRGTIELTADVPAEFREEAGEFILRTAARECTFFLCFDEENAESFDRLLASSRSAWRNYLAEGYVRLPSPELQRVYESSQYNLRIAGTAWSVPTGIFDTHWHGRYFGFDEYFNLMGLLTSGHLGAAVKIPHFRYSILNRAAARTNSSSRPDNGSALYPWESDEAGNENSPSGFWYDHIFHESHIALSAWEAFRYTGNRALLKSEWYPVIRACTEFLRIFGVTYDSAGRRVVRTCTDLERLGPAVANPFMTSCSLIAAFEAAANAAAVLETDAERRRDWETLAAELRATLPRENERYVPYAGCREHSIAQLAGIYPYGVISPRDPLQIAAVADYRNNRSAGGNMYAMGHGICSWYLGWEACTLVRLGDAGGAIGRLEELAAGCGVWGEMYEIGELGMRPYFTTACGVFIQAVNELLLQFSRDGSPVWRDFAFKLRDENGQTVEAACEHGRIQVKQTQGDPQ